MPLTIEKPKLKYFFDTEFIEDGVTIDLISIGICCEDGRKYYALNYDCDHDRASGWVKDNVLVHLPPKPPIGYHGGEGKDGYKHKSHIAQEIAEFCGCEEVDGGFKLKENIPKPEFWAYYANYDWVVLCQLWGTMMQLPRGFPMYCNDIKQFAESLGNPQLPPQGKGEHDALKDAEWNLIAYQFLVDYERTKSR